jgi:cytochrome c oxidase subunit 2
MMAIILFQFSFVPETGAGSPNADEVSNLYKIVFGVAIIVFLGVEGALLYAVLRYRARKGALPALVRGNTRLEIGWTVAPIVVLIVLTAITFIKLPKIIDPARSGPAGLAGAGPLYATVDQPEPPGGRALRIAVNGQQYLWRYTYPNNTYAYDTMVVPEDTTVVLEVRSQDVIHSWWIPKLGGKVDATPGYTNETWFKASKPGTYRGQCAELCGRNHANMLAAVRVVPVPDYERWVGEQKRLIDEANRDAAEQAREQSPIQPGEE